MSALRQGQPCSWPLHGSAARASGFQHRGAGQLPAASPPLLPGRQPPATGPRDKATAGTAGTGGGWEGRGASCSPGLQPLRDACGRHQPGKWLSGTSAHPLPEDASNVFTCGDSLRMLLQEAQVAITKARCDFCKKKKKCIRALKY
jgi:hypothetical protein